MNRLYLEFLLLLLTPALVLAQRYGRPYTFAENPQILLQIKIDKNHRYLRVSDLKKMPRTSMTQIDPVTRTPHTYEGVTLDQLVPVATLASPGERLQIEFGSHQSVTILVSDLDTQPKPIIVDTIDGKPVPGDAPYYFLAKLRSQPLQPITSVDCITLLSR